MPNCQGTSLLYTHAFVFGKQNKNQNTRVMSVFRFGCNFVFVQTNSETIWIYSEIVWIYSVVVLVIYIYI